MKKDNITEYKLSQQTVNSDLLVYNNDIDATKLDGFFHDEKTYQKNKIMKTMTQITKNNDNKNWKT